MLVHMVITNFIYRNSWIICNFSPTLNFFFSLFNLILQDSDNAGVLRTDGQFNGHGWRQVSELYTIIIRRDAGLLVVLGDYGKVFQENVSVVHVLVERLLLRHVQYNAGQ